MTPPCKWPVPNRPFHGFFNFWGQGQVWAPHYTNVCKISGIWWAIPSLLFNKSFSNLKILFILRRSFLILGDPEAVSRVDKMFVVKVFCKIETSSWALTLAEPVPEAFELPASDFFWPISEEKLPGDSRVFLHDVVFLIDRDSCVARSTGNVTRRKFQNKMLTTRKIATFSTATRNKHSPMNF